MGREIRKVPANWNHPTDDNGNHIPIFNENINDALNEWLLDFDRIRSGSLTEDEKEYYPKGLIDWLHDYPPPNQKNHHTYTKEECSWFQVYETISEGTPVSPKFSTKDELIEYLVKNGDYWCQAQGRRPPSREAVSKFVNDEFCFTMGVSNNGIKVGIDSVI